MLTVIKETHSKDDQGHQTQSKPPHSPKIQQSVIIFQEGSWYPQTSKELTKP